MGPLAPLPSLLLLFLLPARGSFAESTSEEPHDSAPGKCSSVFPKFVVRSLIPKMTMKFYYGTGPADYQEEPLDRVAEFLVSEHWHPRRCAAIYIFDHRSWPPAEMNKAIVEGYLSRDRYNVLLVNWKMLAFSAYKAVVAQLGEVAAALARAINPLLAQGARLCHLAGHGLGAPLAAHINGRLHVPAPHIVGLDPLKELFDPTGTQCQRPLAAGDARCVEIVHTDFGRGLPAALGDVDFYVNMDQPKQPGCTLFQFHCSHYRAAALWAEALRSKDLKGRRCDSLEAFEQGSCDDATLRIGRCHGPKGSYYLKTNDKSPYGNNTSVTTEVDNTVYSATEASTEASSSSSYSSIIF